MRDADRMKRHPLFVCNRLIISKLLRRHGGSNAGASHLAYLFSKQAPSPTWVYLLVEEG